MQIVWQVSYISLDFIVGQTWKITSIPQLTQCIDNCFETRNQNIPPFQPMCHIEGVSIVLRLSDAPDARHRLFLYANKTVSSTFPIPESFWPEKSIRRSGDPYSLFVGYSLECISYLTRVKGLPILKYTFRLKMNFVQYMMGFLVSDFLWSKSVSHRN